MQKHKKLAIGLGTGLMVLLFVSPAVLSHCEIPCGIYDDPMRFDMIAEHIQTIEKSMNQITAIEQNKEPNSNQLVRWINNKETHADALSEIVTQYFMTQRIKPVDETDKQGYTKYVQQITSLHQMLVYSMKCKQTTDLENVQKLKDLLNQFKELYNDHTH